MYPYGLNDRLQSVGNVSKPGLRHVNVFNLLNKRKRRKRSHGHRRNRTRSTTPVTLQTLFDMYTHHTRCLHFLLTQLHSLRLADLRT